MTDKQWSPFLVVRTLVGYVLIITAVVQIVGGIYLSIDGTGSISPLIYITLGGVLIFVGVKLVRKIKP